MTWLSSWLPAGLGSGEWMMVIAVAVLIGMAKTGVHGAGMLSVPFLADVFGGQASSGVMLPMLLLADVLGVWYYHRHASWEHLRILFPWAAVGVVAGTVFGKMIDDQLFRLTIAVIIFISLVIMVLLEWTAGKVPQTKPFQVTTGVLGGFTSMVGNLANSVTAVYFLSVRLPKEVFIGTTAWFFLVVNAFKLPFHLLVWETIDTRSFALSLSMLPAIVVGAALGIWVVGRFSDKQYRWFIVLTTAVAAGSMLISR